MTKKSQQQNLFYPRAKTPPVTLMVPSVRQEVIALLAQMLQQYQPPKRQLTDKQGGSDE
jgi:hypothetical protein